VNGRYSSWENIVVKSAEFNVPIADAIFTFKGMNPEKGRRVRHTWGNPEQSELGVWNGKEIVPQTARSNQQIDLEDTVGWWRILLISTTIIALALGGYFTYLRFRQSR